MTVFAAPAILGMVVLPLRESMLLCYIGTLLALPGEVCAAGTFGLGARISRARPSRPRGVRVMSSKKTDPEKQGASSPSHAKPLDRKRVEDLLREGHELRRSIHERFKELRAVGDSAMRFLVR